MNFALGEEEEAVRDLSKQILDNGASFERTREIEANLAGPGYDEALWSQLAEANLIGLPITEALGGQEFSFVALCLLLAEAGRTLAPVPLVESIVYTALPIQEFGSEQLKTDLLPRVIKGDALLTAALFEAGDSGLTRITRTKAKPTSAGFEITGEKICVPFAAAAEKILVAASGDDGLGLFLISPNAKGVTLERQETTAHERQYCVQLNAVPVAGDDVVALPGKGRAVLDWLEPRATTALCAIALGAAEEGLRQTAEYTSTRKQFGREIGSFQGVSLRAADAYIDVEAMRATMLQSAWQIDARGTSPKAAAVAKWWACIGGHRVSHTCQHLHAGIGSDIDYPIHRFYLRLKHVAMTLGGAGQQLSILGILIANEARNGVPAADIIA